MPTNSLDPTQAGAVITRDNFFWATALGQPVTITFGFRSTAPSYFPSFSRSTPTQIDSLIKVLGLWSDAANIKFQQVNIGGFTDQATMLFANASETQGAWMAQAGMPTSKNVSPSSGEGDVWLNLGFHGNDALGSTQFSTNSLGGLDFQTLIHEVGHAIGLNHPGNYNGGTVTYATSANYIEDTWQYTVMSYFSAAETGANHIYNGQTIYASTPLLHDIAAIQRLYGANVTTRTGNTTYGFNSNAGNSYTLTLSTQQTVFSVWDAGGNDTFDFSGYSTPQIIDLNAGQFSSVGALTKNVSIALGVTIENATGGTGSDQIFGNGAANVITGGLGDDSIDGSNGFDVAVLNGARSNYSIVTVTSNRVEVTGTDGHDTLTNVDRLQFADQFVDVSALGQAHTAYSAVLRAVIPDATSNAIEPIIGTPQLSLATYTDQLLTQAEHSTIPSLVIAHYIEGVTPLSARLDSLTAFSAKQFAYYTAMGVADPSLGPYEALGLGFSDTVQFAQRFAALNDTTFISDNYLAAFDRSATAAQVDHFQKQIDYFTRLYVGVGIDAGVAHNHARGAAVGQMFGFAVKEVGNDYFDAANAFLLDASDGSSVNYGTSLMNWA